MLSMGVFISASTKIIDRSTGEVFVGRVPPYSVVVPGSLPGKPLPDGTPGPSLYCAVIVKRVDAQTRAKTGDQRAVAGLSDAWTRRSRCARPRPIPHPLPVVTPGGGRALAFIDERAAARRVSRSTGRSFRAAERRTWRTSMPAIGTGEPYLLFAGHTDVVPPGDAALAARSVRRRDRGRRALRARRGRHEGRHRLHDGGGARLHARTAASSQGSIGFLITGDEEGPAINGTVKLLEWAGASAASASTIACSASRPIPSAWAT